MTLVKKQGQDDYYALVGRASVAYAYLPTFQNWLSGHMTTPTNLVTTPTNLVNISTL